MSFTAPKLVRSPLLWLIIPFATGIAIAHACAAKISLEIWALAAAVALGLCIVSLRTFPALWGFLLGVGLTAVGGIHYALHREQLPAWEVLPDREAVLTVQVTRDFGSLAEDRYQNILGRIVRARHPLDELVGQSLHARIRRPSSNPHAIQRGAAIEAVGQIEWLDPVNSVDDFDLYLHDSGHNFRLHQGRFIKSVEPPSDYARFRHETKTKAAEILGRGFDHRPFLSAALGAMLLGEKYRLDEATKTTFLRSGTMHLFAISGLHIGVIAVAINGLLRLVRVDRRIAFLIGSLILLAYVDLIGLTPSAVRAWIMITCFHGARVLRAPGNSVAAISTSALLVLLLDPMQLFSAGFQMSYTVVFVLLLHGIPLGTATQEVTRPWRHLPGASLNRRQRWVQNRAKDLTMAVAFTWSASLIGMITGVGVFGWFSPLAFVTNLILVPLASLAITAGFASIVLGLMGVTVAATLFNHAGAMVLWTMLELLTTPLSFARGVPASFGHLWWDEFGIIVVMAAVIGSHEFPDLPPRIKWSLPTLATLLVLVFGINFS